MQQNITQLNGTEPGKTSIILVGVHGNEKCGIEAIQEILQTLEIKKGRVFIANGNPKAIEQNVRYTEANLNRMFKPEDQISEKDKMSYEFKRAEFLKKYLDESDVLLDVHASFVPDSRVFTICEPNSDEIVKYLPVNLVVNGFDSIEPGGTDYYMNKIGKIGICVECGYLEDESSKDVAKESIYSFLGAMGHIEYPLVEKAQDRILMNRIYLTKTDSFKLTKAFKDFEEIKSGEVIGLDGSEEVMASEDSIILFATNVNEVGGEGFLLGRWVSA